MNPNNLEILELNDWRFCYRYCGSINEIRFNGMDDKRRKLSKWCKDNNINLFDE